MGGLSQKPSWATVQDRRVATVFDRTIREGSNKLNHRYYGLVTEFAADRENYAFGQLVPMITGRKLTLWRRANRIG